MQISRSDQIRLQQCIDDALPQQQSNINTMQQLQINNMNQIPPNTNFLPPIQNNIMEKQSKVSKICTTYCIFSNSQIK